jgi:hypothetical protein
VSFDFDKMGAQDDERDFVIRHLNVRLFKLKAELEGLSSLTSLQPSPTSVAMFQAKIDLLEELIKEISRSDHHRG